MDQLPFGNLGIGRRTQDARLPSFPAVWCKNLLHIPSKCGEMPNFETLNGRVLLKTTEGTFCGMSAEPAQPSEFGGIDFSFRVGSVWWSRVVP